MMGIDGMLYIFFAALMLSFIAAVVIHGRIFRHTLKYHEAKWWSIIDQSSYFSKMARYDGPMILYPLGSWGFMAFAVDLDDCCDDGKLKLLKKFLIGSYILLGSCVILFVLFSGTSR